MRNKIIELWELLYDKYIIYQNELEYIRRASIYKNKQVSRSNDNTQYVRGRNNMLVEVLKIIDELDRETLESNYNDKFSFKQRIIILFRGRL